MSDPESPCCYFDGCPEIPHPGSASYGWMCVDHFQEYRAQTVRVDVQDLVREKLAAQSPVKIGTFDDWLTMPDVTWLIRDWLPEACIAGVIGPPYVGKSMLTLLLAGCVATGQDFLGMPVEGSTRRDVIVCLGEGQSGMGQQSRALVAALGGEKPGIYPVNEPFPLTPDKARVLVRQAREREICPAMVVFDAKADFFIGKANSEDDAEQFIRGMKIIREEFACAVVSVIHSGLEDEDRERGSSRIRDALEVRWVVSAGTLTPRKVKNRTPPDPVHFAIRPVGGTEGAMPVRVSPWQAALTAGTAGTQRASAHHGEVLSALAAAPGMKKADLLKLVRKICSCDQETAARTIETMIEKGLMSVEQRGCSKIHYAASSVT